jgi:hypothetical protein
MQVTVLVGKDDGFYRQRFDMFLPKGKRDGPLIQYNWNGSDWMTDCQKPLGVAMPEPTLLKQEMGDVGRF